MVDVRRTAVFSKWFGKLRDKRAKVRIAARLDRIEKDGLFGDVKTVREGISEIRISYGPGYRLYFVRDGSAVVILLSGGNKGSQQADIAQAIQLSKQLQDREDGS